MPSEPRSAAHQRDSDELREEWMRGFREGHAAGRAGTQLVLETLDILIDHGLTYQQARDQIERISKFTEAKS